MDREDYDELLIEQFERLVKIFGSNKCVICGEPLTIETKIIDHRMEGEKKKNHGTNLLYEVKNMSDEEIKGKFQLLCGNCNDLKADTYYAIMNEKSIDTEAKKSLIKNFIKYHGIFSEKAKNFLKSKFNIDVDEL